MKTNTEAVQGMTSSFRRGDVSVICTLATILRIFFLHVIMKLDQRCSGDPVFFHNYTGYTSMLLRLRFSLHILDIRYSSIIFPNKELHKIPLQSRGVEESWGAPE